MQKDYPQANARLAEVARSWADGELSHDAWRKERRAIIKNIWLRKADVDSNQFGALPIKARSKKNDTQTLPNITIPPLISHKLDATTTILLTEDTEALQEDVFLLGVLLFSMVITTVFMVYML